MDRRKDGLEEAGYRNGHAVVVELEKDSPERLTELMEEHDIKLVLYTCKDSEAMTATRLRVLETAAEENVPLLVVDADRCPQTCRENIEYFPTLVDYRGPQSMTFGGATDVLSQCVAA